MESSYPMRINKYLALSGHSTRRGADALIEEGKVFINGRRAVLGDKVNKDDRVEVKGSVKRAASYTYFAYHKPRGIITHSPRDTEEDIREITRNEKELIGTFPIGRLDKDSSGLIILTNDGRVTDRMLNPEYEHEKEYAVQTKDRLRDSFKKNMEGGLVIEDYQTKPCKVVKTGEKAFTITLTEGKKHQIRRMVSALHNEVSTLKRTRVMNIRLGNLPQGEFRKIEGDELKEFLKSLGL